jgi:hypothetical protein
MSTLTTRPMRLWFVEFDELFARHLCRHSQTGVNVIHLIALFAIWYAVYGLLYWIVGIEWVLAIPAVAYLIVVAPNLPIRVLAATTLFLSLVVAADLFLPSPWWVYLIIVPVAYEIQALSHKVYTVESDMTEFNQKYTKGPILFVVLLIYEVPIVVNFLLFGQRRVELREEPSSGQPMPIDAARVAEGDQERTAANAS